MFEANNLIHFVFANDNDLYYCRNSLKMDLEQRLWWELQQAGYKNIYYLDSVSKDFLGSGDKDFEISTFGEPGKELPASGILWSPTTTPNEKAFRQGLGNWMQNESAVVCRLDTFCEVMDNVYRYGKTWEELQELEKKHNGVLILTVSPDAEELFETSRFLRFYRKQTTEMKFLDGNSELSVRNRARWMKTNNCVLWNEFSEKELQYFLHHVILQDPAKISDYGSIKELAVYLSMALDQDAILNDRIFAGRMIGSYQDLFPILADPENWKRLNRNCRSTSLQRFYEQYQIPDELEKTSVTAEGGKKITEDIKAALEGLDRSECNARIRAYLGWFLLLLRRKEVERDWGSCERVLYAIRFCLQWIHTDRGSEEEAAIIAVILQLKQYIKLSEDFFMEEKNLASIQIKDEHGFAAKVRQQLVAKHAVSAQFLTRFEDLMLSSMLKLSMQHSAVDIRQIADAIEQLTNEMENSKTDSLEELVIPTKIPEEKSEESEPEKQKEPTEEEYEYSITEEMYTDDIGKILL